MENEDIESAVRALGGETRRDVSQPSQPIVFVSLWNTAANDATIALLRGLEHVQRLAVRFTAVTDEGLRCLGGWQHLEGLDCGFARVEGHGLQWLNPDCPLTSLSLAGAMCDPTNIQHIIARVSLKWLDLQNTCIVDSDVQCLGVLSRLQDLNLSRTNITDAIGSTLGEMKALRVLHLRETPVGIHALAQIKKLPKLEELSLSGCPNVNDDALEQLAMLSSIREIAVINTGVTRQGVRNVMRLFSDNTRKYLKIVL